MNAPKTKRSIFARARARISGRAELLKVRWFGAKSPAQAAKALALRASRMPAPPERNTRLLLLGPDSPFRCLVAAELEKYKLGFLTCDTSELGDVETILAFHGIVCCATESAALMHVLSTVQAQSSLAVLPFEYVTGLEKGRKLFEQYDEYSDAHFISPLLHAATEPYSIYQQSLQYFEQKTGLRDFLDLYQTLAELERRTVPGSICEFGSYRGHSGWLLATSLAALNSSRRLFMFDTFDSFPQENLGVDSLWSDTHAVDYASVRKLLEPFSNVSLVKGDITDTVANQDTGPIALAYVDCDSYRAIHFLTQELWAKRIVPGGFMVLEDYGHPALLGCRQAVHEYFDQRTDAHCFFSQFSGLMLISKLP